MKFTKKMLKAIEKTVFRYEDTICRLENIEDPEDARLIVDQWRRYGGARFCLLCSASNPGGRFWEKDCRRCLLRLPGTSYPHSVPCQNGSMEQSYKGLKMEIAQSCYLLNPSARKRANKDLIGALKTRLRVILRRVGNNGYELK